MLHASWTARSLRFWIAVGMVVAIMPLTLSAAAGYVMLQRGVIAPFHDVSSRQREQVQPLQHLRVLIWDTLIPVDEFVDEGGAQRPGIYRDLRAQIETEFAGARERIASDPSAATLVTRASDHWLEADAIGTELVSVERPPGDPEAALMMERFHGQVAAASDMLGAAYGVVAGKIEQDHQQAIASYQRSMWIAGVAAWMSLAAMIMGVLIIGRVMAASVDRLVEGASRFAEGDRDHRIDIRVPPELRKVADEFNRMIARICESEEALEDLARRDGLTQLLNRRAFDEAMSELQARLRRGGDEGALLTLDLDHFKAINDTHGHASGDQVLRAFARTMTSELRPFDRAYRIGGEEFSVLLPSASMATAREIAERIRQAVADTPVEAEGGTISVTVSIGVAKTIQGLSPEELTGAADAALYRAKTTGRNRVVSIDDTGAHAHGAAEESGAPAKAAGMA